MLPYSQSAPIFGWSAAQVFHVWCDNSGSSHTKHNDDMVVLFIWLFSAAWPLEVTCKIWHRNYIESEAASAAPSRKCVYIARENREESEKSENIENRELSENSFASPVGWSARIRRRRRWRQWRRRWRRWQRNGHYASRFISGLSASKLPSSWRVIHVAFSTSFIYAEFVNCTSPSALYAAATAGPAAPGSKASCGVVSNSSSILSASKPWNLANAKLAAILQIKNSRIWVSKSSINLA